MRLFEKLKALNRERKHKNRTAIEKAEEKIWWNSCCKLISPNRIEVFDTNLIIDQTTWVRSLIVGLPTKNGEGYNRDMTSKAIERIQNISFDKCKIMISHSLIQITNTDARENLQKASFTVNVNQEHARQVNQGAGEDLALMCQSEDIRANYRKMYFQGQRSFHSSFIIVITGPKEEVLTAESYIISILKSEIIEVIVPFGKQLEMFMAAMPFPITDSKSWVEVPSDTAAMLCTSTNLNSRTDVKGLYFGKDLKTNADVLEDLDELAAKHLTFLGATGSGKTFSFLLLLMRMHDMCNSRIVYTTPKADIGTDYRAVAAYYGQDACIVDVGPGKSNINPLQILFDSQTMGTSPYAYARAYDRHKGLLIKFFNVWFGNVSINQESYLDETLNIAYEQAGIYRDQPETWTNAWPVFRNLRDIWEKDMNKSSKEVGTKKKTAEALFHKTYQMGEKGTLNYMNKPTTDLDLSKDFIIIDLSDVDEIINDAMNVLVTGMTASRFSTDSEKETIIAVDEAAVYLRNPELSTSMLKTLTQGRSHKVFLWLATHQPSDFSKNKVKEEYKTNMFINIVLGVNIENSIDDVKDYFKLNEEESELLCSFGDAKENRGKGLLLLKGQRIPIFFEATDLEMSVIKGTYTKKIASTDDGIKVFPELLKLVDEHKIYFSDWSENPSDLAVLLKQVYDRHKVQRVAGNGIMMVYVLTGFLNENKLIDKPHLGKQTLDHYSSVVQLAGHCMQLPIYEDVEVHHNSDVDVSARVDGKTIGLEYENYNNKNIETIVKKKEAALAKYDIVKFICSQSDYSTLVKAVGENYVLQRGGAVLEFLQNPSGISMDEITDQENEAEK